MSIVPPLLHDELWPTLQEASFIAFSVAFIAAILECTCCLLSGDHVNMQLRGWSVVLPAVTPVTCQCTWCGSAIEATALLVLCTDTFSICYFGQKNSGSSP